MSESPIHVLFVTPSLRMGGAEKHLVRLLRHFDRRRIRPRLAAHYAGGELFEQLAADVPCHGLRPGCPRSALLRALGSVLPLRRLVATHRPAIVCAFQDLASVVAGPALQSPARHGPKLVVSVQNTPGSHRDRSAGPLRKALFALARRVYRRADLLIAASQGVTTDLRALTPPPAAPIERIYNAGFDDIPPPGDAHGITKTDDAPLLVSCGRLVAQKDPIALVEAMARSRHRPRLWMIGEGPLRSRIERRAAELGVANRLEILGFQEDPRPWLATADLFVSASHHEGFGNVLVEAMACGTPVVATDCPHGPAEILDAGAAGALVPPRNIDALAQAIDGLLEDPERARALAAKGRERALAFRPSVSARRHSEVFELLVGQGVGPG